MQKLFTLFVLVLVLGGCHKDIYVIKSNFNASVAPPPPNYSQLENWASLPSKKDAADSIPIKSNLTESQATAKADVFFIHPTIFTNEPTNQYQWNADVNDSELNNQIQRSTILNQASIFNESCRIYAPYYRQAHLYSFYTPNKSDGEQALDLAYQDVKAAFEYYLLHLNEGRPFVIASHSQGSYHAERLIKEFIDGKPLQKKLVAAYLVGRAMPPNSFAHIQPTQQPDEVGVWASWNTFAKNYLPRNYDQHFKGSLSTNPLLWNSSEDFASNKLNDGGVALHFTFAPHLADAQNHQGILWTNKPYIKGRLFLHSKNWHRADLNLFYLNIRENVALRIGKYFEGAQSSLPGND